jgi:hypothetical protein
MASHSGIADGNFFSLESNLIYRKGQETIAQAHRKVLPQIDILEGLEGRTPEQITEKKKALESSRPLLENSSQHVLDSDHQRLKDYLQFPAEEANLGDPNLERQILEIFGSIQPKASPCKNKDKRRSAKEVKELSPWQLSTTLLFKAVENLNALCFGMPGLGKTAIMLEIMVQTAHKAIDEDSQPPTLILIYLHSVEQVKEFEEHWTHFKTDTAEKLRRDAKVLTHYDLDASKDKYSALCLAIEPRRPSGSAVHVLVIPIDKAIRFKIRQEVYH